MSEVVEGFVKCLIVHVMCVMCVLSVIVSGWCGWMWNVGGSYNTSCQGFDYDEGGEHRSRASIQTDVGFDCGAIKEGCIYGDHDEGG